MGPVRGLGGIVVINKQLRAEEGVVGIMSIPIRSYLDQHADHSQGPQIAMPRE